MTLAHLLQTCDLLYPSPVRLAFSSVNHITFSQAAAKLSCLFPPSVLLIKAELQLCHIQCHCNFLLLLQGCPAGSSPGMVIPQHLSSAVQWPLLQGVNVLFISHFCELQHCTLQPAPGQGGFADLLPAIIVDIVANHILRGDFPRVLPFLSPNKKSCFLYHCQAIAKSVIDQWS